MERLSERLWNLRREAESKLEEKVLADKESDTFHEEVLDLPSTVYTDNNGYANHCTVFAYADGMFECVDQEDDIISITRDEIDTEALCMFVDMYVE